MGKQISVLVIGASTNPGRYSNMALQLLQEHGHRVYALGAEKGRAHGVPIDTTWPTHDLHTITMYLRPELQEAYLSQLLKSKPDRVIFNPGSENPKLAKALTEAGIHVEEACTLVLLRTQQFA